MLYLHYLISSSSNPGNYTENTTFNQGSANIFLAEGESKYFVLGEPYDLCRDGSSLPLGCDSSQGSCINEIVGQCANKTLWMGTDFTFH